MNLKQSIMDQYTAADEDQRLGLYLIHRDLREDFMKIELTATAKTAVVKNKETSRGRWATLHRCCFHWMKLGRV